MNWFDKQIWKHSFISALIGLLGCTIGTIGVLYIFDKHSWEYLFISSMALGLLSCVAIVYILNIFHKESGFKKPLNISLSTSTISLLSMLFVENSIIIVTHSHQTIPIYSNQYWHLFIGMIISCIVLIPINYYLLKKPTKIKQKLLR
jgi:MFS family permease